MKTDIKKWAEIGKYIRANADKINNLQGVIGKNEDGSNIWDKWDYYETTARISKMFKLDPEKDADKLFALMDKYTFAAY